MRNFLNSEKYRKHRQWIFIFLLLVLGFFLISSAGIAKNLREAFKKQVTNQATAVASSIGNIFSGTKTGTTSQTSAKLVISKINVSAEVEEVGKNSAGEMDVPSDIDKVAWFKLGSYPGNAGSAVISGHFDGEHGQTAVFTNLRKLTQGDEVDYITLDGKTIKFVVRETKLYGADQIVPEVFTTNGESHLNLITCAGSWDNDTKEFSQRLVVFCDLKK